MQKLGRSLSVEESNIEVSEDLATGLVSIGHLFLRALRESRRLTSSLLPENHRNLQMLPCLAHHLESSL